LRVSCRPDVSKERGSAWAGESLHVADTVRAVTLRIQEKEGLPKTSDVMMSFRIDALILFA
jgi:hypothetical protein